MFRIAPIVLFAASLCSLATAQKGLQKEPLEKPAANGTQAPSDQPKPLGSAKMKMWAHGPMLEAFVHSSEPGFVGIVGLSLSKDLTYSFGLPPLLTGAVVMAYGATDTENLGLRAPIAFLPSESITFYGQALVIDEKGLWSSNVVGVVISGQYDGT